jgi:two-component system sensor histidine kinase/response regulator
VRRRRIIARILIIEDDPHVAYVLQLALEEEGHEVITSYDGQNGLRQLEQPPLPDLVLVDLCIPVLSGRTVVETIYNNRLLHKIPVIITSGSTPDTLPFPPACAYRALFTKPYDIFALRDTINQLLHANAGAELVDAR